MSTATISPASTGDAAPLPSPDELEGQYLRGMAAAAPAEALEAMRYHAPNDDGSHPADAIHRGGSGLRSLIGSARGKIRKRARGRYRVDYLLGLAAGGAAEPPPYAPPSPGRDEEAAQVLRAIVGRDPLRFGGIVALVDRTLVERGAELAWLAAPVAMDAFEWLKADGPHPLHHPDERDKQKRVLVAMDAATKRQSERIAKIPELGELIDRLGRARGALEAAFRGRVASAVRAAGGPAGLAEALREASRLGGDAPADDEQVVEARGELGGVEASLSKLGVDPAAGTPAGLAAKQLVSRRSELMARIAEMQGDAATAEATGHGSLVDQALAFSPSAWAKILASAQAQPSAFPAGFAASWSAIAVDALVEAGAADFVEPFEAA